MANVTTKPDVRHNGNVVEYVWKSITLNSGDILISGLLEVWEVAIQDPTKWATPSWTVGTGTNRGKITVTLTGPHVGRVVVRGR